MLMIGIIRDISGQISDSAPSVSYYFCQGTDQTAQNSATAILRSKIWMLVAQQPDLMKHIRQEHDRQHRDNIFSDSRNALEAASRIFKKLVMSTAPAYLAVDALDECDEDLETLLQLISTSLKSSKDITWIISSRPHINVHVLFDRLGVGNVDDAIEILVLDTQKLDGLVNIYVDHKLSTFAGRPGYNNDVLKKLSGGIRERKEKTYLWVALVFDMLDEKDDDLQPVHGSYALGIIKEIPPGLVQLYDHMMRRIEKKKRSDPVHCRNILATLVLAYRPLSFGGLATVAGLKSTVPEPQTIVNNCGSFLTVDNDLVFLVHQSAKDYLLQELQNLDTGAASRLQSTAIEMTINIVTRSVDAMSQSFGPRQRRFERKYERVSTQELAPLRYSCLHWVDHLEAVASETAMNSPGIQAVYDQSFTLIETYFLLWFESLAFLYKAVDGIFCLERLLAISKLKVTRLFHHQTRTGLTSGNSICRCALKLLSSWRTEKSSLFLLGQL